MGDERFESLERRVLELERELAEMRQADSTTTATMDPPLHSSPPRPAPFPAKPVPAPVVAPLRTAPAPTAPRPLPSPTAPRRSLTLEDVLSPRNLAVAGAVAVIIGVAFLVSLGISAGWISETVRVVAAGIFSVLLAAAGFYLHERRRAGTPAQALTVIGAVGMFITLTAATRLYSLVDPVVALILSALIGVFGVLAGLRWQNEAVAGSITAAALMAPLMIEATYSVGLLGFLIPMFIVAVASSVIRPWQTSFVVAAVLFLCSLVACIVDASGGDVLGAYSLATLTTILLATGSIGHLMLNRQAEEQGQALVYGALVTVSTLLGAVMVQGSGTPVFECIVGYEGAGPCNPDYREWLAAWFFTSAAIGAVAWLLALRNGRKAVAVTAFSLASAAVAAGLGFLFEGGPLLSLAWSVQAASLFAFGQTPWQRRVGYFVLGLAGIVVLIEVPFSLLFDSTDELLKDLAVVAPLLIPLGLLATRAGESARAFGGALLVTTATYMGVITAGALVAPDSWLNLVPLVLASALPLMLADRDWTRGTFIFFEAAAITFALATTLPFDALVDGVPSAPEAMITVVLLAVPAVAVLFRGPAAWRQPALWVSLGFGLYLVSILVVDGFQGTETTEGGLPGTAQGQVIVSTLWALCGLALVVSGLKRSRATWRKAGLVLLVLSMLKITLYDLSSLSSAGRTISFILVGLVLLAAAFAYQWMSRKPDQPA